MEADQSLDSGEPYFHRDANNWNVQVRPASHTFRHVDDLITLLIRFEQLAGTNLQHSFWTSLNSELSFYWYGGLGVLLSLVTFFFHVTFQFKVHKCRNGDDIEEYDKYFNSYRGDIYFQEGSE
jgi:hypothetical protein